MMGDPGKRLAELRDRSWSTGAEFDALNLEYAEALAELAQSIDIGSPIPLATTAGKDFRDRQSIKRKSDRWKESFRKMTSLEQVTIFAAICEAMSENVK